MRKPSKQAVKRWLNSRVLDPALDFQVSKVTKVARVERVGSCLQVSANVIADADHGGAKTGIRVKVCRGGRPQIELGPRFR